MIQKDQAGNAYIEVENLRVTYVDQEVRSQAKNWANSDVVRIQAKKDGSSNKLHLGSEIPISSPIVILDLINALINLYRDKASS